MERYGLLYTGTSGKINMENDMEKRCCGNCELFVQSGNAHRTDTRVVERLNDGGECRLNPLPIYTTASHWCGQYRANRHRREQTYTGYADRYETKEEA